MRYAILILILCSLSAQPVWPQTSVPPAGWQRVLDLDSMNYPEFYGANDTIALWTSKQGSGQRKHYILTTNGGVTWDTLRTDHFPAPMSFLPNSTTLYASTYDSEDSVIQFWFSTDLGKTFEHHDVDRELSKFVRGASRRGILVNPHDPNDLFAKFAFPGPFVFTESQFFLRSKDRGRTWKVQDLPVVLDGDGLEYELSFDVRVPGRWYIAVFGQNHSLTGWHVHKTTNNGQSFEELESLGGFSYRRGSLNHSGLDGPGTFRREWIDVENGGGGYDVINESGDTLARVDLVAEIYPNEPKYGSEKKGWGMSPSAIVYSSFSPDYWIISTGYNEIREDSIVTGKYELHFTSDNGRSWKRIYHAVDAYPIATKFLDSYTGSVWVATLDEMNSHIGMPASLNRSLWKRANLLVTDAKLQRFERLELIVNPLNRVVFIPRDISVVARVTVRDLIGRSCAVLEAQSHDANWIRIQLPTYLGEGTFLLETDSRETTRLGIVSMH